MSFETFEENPVSRAILHEAGLEIFTNPGKFFTFFSWTPRVRIWGLRQGGKIGTVVGNEYRNTKFPGQTQVWTNVD